jgi:hypothetical protein
MNASTIHRQHVWSAGQHWTSRFFAVLPVITLASFVPTVVHTAVRAVIIAAERRLKWLLAVAFSAVKIHLQHTHSIEGLADIGWAFVFLNNPNLKEIYYEQRIA